MLSNPSPPAKVRAAQAAVVHHEVDAVARQELGEGIQFNIGLGLLCLVDFRDALAIALEVGFVQTLRYIGLQVFDHLQHEFMAKCLQAKVYFAHPY
jgi:hypothetical protein